MIMTTIVMTKWPSQQQHLRQLPQLLQRPQLLLLLPPPLFVLYRTLVISVTEGPGYIRVILIPVDPSRVQTEGYDPLLCRQTDTVGLGLLAGYHQCSIQKWDQIQSLRPHTPPQLPPLTPPTLPAWFVSHHRKTLQTDGLRPQAQNRIRWAGRLLEGRTPPSCGVLWLVPGYGTRAGLITHSEENLQSMASSPAMDKVR